MGYPVAATDEPYTGLAAQYIEDILSSERSACNYVKFACERQKRDLESPPAGYTFDHGRAARICRFIELLPHIKGKWAGTHITLEPWQAFILTTVFGWVDARGYRRFKTAYTEVPRKNAKSTISSGVALYLMSADGEAGAEVYSAATTRDQAKIVWQDAKRMVDSTPGLRHKFNVHTTAHSIHVEDTASWFRTLSRDQGGNLDGLNVYGAIVDELHAHKTRDVWDVIETGTGSREDPMMWAITTSGFNRAGICYEQRAYTIKVLQGVVDDPEYFGIIYTIDDGDEWTDEASWIKANPNWDVSVKPDDIRRKARKAMEMAAAQNNFLTKHLNVWVNADTAWLDMRAWDRCSHPELTLEQFEGKPCWIALDLASKLDIASIALLFRQDDKYIIFTQNYLPEDAAEEGRNSQYGGWVREGRLITTSGNVTDYGAIEDDLREMAGRFDVQEIGYDPWQSQYLANNLTEDGLNLSEYRQTVQNMSEPMKELEASVMAGNLRHDSDPVLTWMISNVVAHLDAKENVYPRKEFPENKIDGVIAVIMALGLYLRKQNEVTPYAFHGLRVIDV